MATPERVSIGPPRAPTDLSRRRTAERTGSCRPGKTGGAWDGDTVQVESEANTDGERDTVRVIKVLRRAHTAVTGILRKHDHKCWLEPDERKLPSPMLVTGKLHNAHAGDRVAVAVRSYAAGLGQTPSGEVVQIFGPAGELAAIVAAILYNHHIQPAFPDLVMEEALSIPETLTEQDLAGRLDLRAETIVTIDGASSRDFDDAVSLTRDEAGNWRLGVHIADVSHYVKAKSALDREAWERGTSVYFADRVVPMLPIALSNGICSLNPQVDRLTISCLMTLDRAGTILDHSLAKSVICSTERMTYEACNVLLAGGDSALEARYAHILPMLRDMDQLAAALKRRRRARGALMLESSEVAIACDEEGRPTDLSLRQPGRAESLIEECMLAANETVARHLHDAGQPCVYRIHEKPASDKLEALRAMLNPLGYTVGQGDGFALQAVLDAAQDKPRPHGEHHAPAGHAESALFGRKSGPFRPGRALLLPLYLPHPPLSGPDGPPGAEPPSGRRGGPQGGAQADRCGGIRGRPVLPAGGGGHRRPSGRSRHVTRLSSWPGTSGSASPAWCPA